MEKKTIGGFISELRKSQDMTQRELADRLNVLLVLAFFAW